MKAQLKNVKYSAFASHETSCFEATLYVDGVKTAIIDNDGRGGCDRVHALNRSMLDAYEATLPPGYCPLEIAVAEMLNRWLVARDLKRWLKKLSFITKDCEKGQIRQLTAPYSKELGDKLRLKHPDAVILNELPLEDALDLVMAH